MVWYVDYCTLEEWHTRRMPNPLQGPGLSILHPSRVDLTNEDLHWCGTHLAYRVTRMQWVYEVYNFGLIFTQLCSGNLRIGKDFTASAVVLLCKLKLYQGRSLNARLRAAFKSYMKWCSVNKKNTNILVFSKKAFKMKSILLCIWNMLHGLHGAWGSYYFLWATLSGTMPFLQQLEARGQTPPYCLHGWRMKWGPWWLVFKKCTIPQFWSQLNHWSVWGLAKECDNSLFDLLHYAVRCSNAFYRLLHWRGLWLTAEDNAFAAQAAQETTDPWTICDISDCFIIQ